MNEQATRKKTSMTPIYESKGSSLKQQRFASSFRLAVLWSIRKFWSTFDSPRKMSTTNKPSNRITWCRQISNHSRQPEAQAGILNVVNWGPSKMPGGVKPKNSRASLWLQRRFEYVFKSFRKQKCKLVGTCHNFPLGRFSAPFSRNTPRGSLSREKRVKSIKGKPTCAHCIGHDCLWSNRNSPIRVCFG